MITCFTNIDGEISYFGVIIKIFQSSEHKQTLKNLWKDENNINPSLMFKEKIISELSDEKIKNVTIGNGFIGLLSEKGLVYVVDMNDNIALLYSKFFVYSLSISNNQLFGLCKENNINRSFHDDENYLQDIGIKNIYMSKWEMKTNEANEEWKTTVYKFSDDFTVENLIFGNFRNKDILLLDYYETCTKNHSCFDVKKDFDIICSSHENEFFTLCQDNYNYNKHRKFENVLSFMFNFDDSYNIIYKRMKIYFDGVLMV